MKLEPLIESHNNSTEKRKKCIEKKKLVHKIRLKNTSFKNKIKKYI